MTRSLRLWKETLSLFSYSYKQLERKRDSKIRKFRPMETSLERDNCSTRLLVHRFKGKIGKISEERSGLAERLVRLLHSSSRPCRYRIVTRWTGDARKQGSSNGRVGIEIWYGQLSLARRGTRKASFHRAESGRIFALFASKTRGSLGDACPPPEKAFCFPTFPPLISLRLNGLVYVTPRFDWLNIPTDPFERRGFTPNVPAKPVPMSLDAVASC